jgi:hypothetical protein
MKLSRFLVASLVVSGGFVVPGRAEWQRTPVSVAWTAGGEPLWQFSFDPAKGKTFFHPLSIEAGRSLTNFQPQDHPWHYGLWFSWKYINGANYWEEDRATGRAEGRTTWTTPQIVTQPDGAAAIRYEVTYTHPSGRVDLREIRELNVSAPTDSGGYSIDWRSRFTAGESGAVLARTPMPNEPNGQVNGGYAGLGLRLTSAPARVDFVTADERVMDFQSDRARPASPALACNVSEAGQEVGSIAIFSDPANVGGHAPWYIVNGEMRFVCAAVLAPKVRTLPAGSDWTLRYRIVIGARPWTPARLRAAYDSWRQPR